MEEGRGQQQQQQQQGTTVEVRVTPRNGIGPREVRSPDRKARNRRKGGKPHQGNGALANGGPEGAQNGAPSPPKSPRRRRQTPRKGKGNGGGKTQEELAGQHLMALITGKQTQ